MLRETVRFGVWEVLIFPFFLSSFSVLRGCPSRWYDLGTTLRYTAFFPRNSSRKMTCIAVLRLGVLHCDTTGQLTMILEADNWRDRFGHAPALFTTAQVAEAVNFTLYNAC